MPCFATNDFMKIFLNTKNINQITKVFVFVVLFALGSSSAFAAPWAPPPTNTVPPANQATSTLNVSGILQTKLGGLIVGAGVAPTGVGLMVPNGNVGIGLPSGILPGKKLDVGGYIKANGFCIGNDCRTSWDIAPPTITGVKKIIAGEGISVSPLDGRGNVTIANTGVGGTSTGVEVKLFCIPNNPPNHNQCPSTGGNWISAGVLDNGGSAWCFDPANQNTFIVTPSSDVVLCYRSI